MRQVEGVLLAAADGNGGFNMLEMDYLEEVSWIRMALSLPAGLVKAAKLESHVEERSFSSLGSFSLFGAVLGMRRGFNESSFARGSERTVIATFPSSRCVPRLCGKL